MTGWLALSFACALLALSQLVKLNRTYPRDQIPNLIAAAGIGLMPIAADVLLTQAWHGLLMLLSLAALAGLP